MNRTPSLTVALDLDSTIYDLHTPWLAYLRDQLGEDISDGFLSWDVHKQYSRSGVRAYNFLEQEGVFFNLAPLPMAVAAIRAVQRRGDVRQVFASTVTTKTGAWEKHQAIKRDFPELASELLITSGSKDLVRADVLVDDGPHNLDVFPGITIKVPYAYNTETRATYTMNSWDTYPRLIAQIIEAAQ